MKKIIGIAIIALVILFLTPYLHEYFGTVSEAGNPVTVTIPQGATADDIADILVQNGVIKHKITFRLRVRLSEYNGKLNYGTFTLDDGMCLRDIIETIAAPGNQNSITLVIPEGFSAERIAQRAEQTGICTAEEFLSAMADDYNHDFIKYIPDGNYKYKLQGFLFPDTYVFSTDTSAHDIIDTMLAEFEKRYLRDIGAADSSMFDIVIKASLVEKEAMLESERPLIAGVIDNRIKNGMPLQIDAAIVYTVTDGLYNVDKVYYKDLETDSPYNIYKNKGLPAGPICSPGMSSIKAAKNPKASSYLYYHTDTEKNDGSHIFTETFDEHVSTMN